ncbi:cellulose biosynthesis protein BcsF [Frateuria aurantia]|uniref:Cellulose biosynthesis protein BcsF n=1 Tax=Frateuria aurantia (strain ATCC 33424 / DSM 6220 / KCTC 2777 / LMG 1558 / NBRC 3245 / NCIMB 13370) TaxID=767434 RepID=H8L5Y3_FRAAD|nr:cellulose biosynthesis protein BcsF [Frateuria aurantia]AFC86726.1 Protein of unknown function (DUF2636) [Frateuria aurantia DSM 6220]
MDYSQAIQLITATAIVAGLAGWLAHEWLRWLRGNLRRILPPRHLRHQLTRIRDTGKPPA